MRSWGDHVTCAPFDDGPDSPLYSSFKAKVANLNICSGQTIVYMVGRLNTSNLRDKAQKALGSNIDVCGCYDTIFKSGSAPLDVFEEQVDD